MSDLPLENGEFNPAIAMRLRAEAAEKRALELEAQLTVADKLRDIHSKSTEALHTALGAANKKVKALEAIVALLKNAQSGHYSHWDRTMRGGAGCKECARVCEINQKVRELERSD